MPASSRTGGPSSKPFVRGVRFHFAAAARRPDPAAAYPDHRRGGWLRRRSLHSGYRKRKVKVYPADGAAWWRLLIPIAGSLTAGFFLARYFPNARGSGIPQTKTALFLRDGYISFKTVLGKFSLCSLTLASGIALGREGPSVHIAAGIASVLGRRLGLSPRSVRALLPIGAAAALAAAFNTPIAAVLFTLEEVMGDMHAPVLGSIVLSSATSWMVLHLLLGEEPLFHVPSYQLVHPVEFVFWQYVSELSKR